MPKNGTVETVRNRRDRSWGLKTAKNWLETIRKISGTTPGPFTVEVRMEKPVGLHGSRLRPIPGEKVKLGYRASKCRKTDRESLTWK